MNITSKDRSMLLLIATIAVFLWFMVAHGIDLVTAPNFDKSKAVKFINISSSYQDNPYNLSRKLKKTDLKNKIVILSFFDPDCKSCYGDIEFLNDLKKKFGNKIAIFVVYDEGSKSKLSKKAIKKIILRRGVNFAVVVDEGSKIAKEFAMESATGIALLDSKGRYIKVNDKNILDKKIAKIIRKYRYDINNKALPISLERNAIVKNVLSFPSKIEYATKFKYESYEGKAFFVANSGAGNIMAFKESGEVITKIGSSDSGYLDLDIKRSKFRSPTGMLFYKNKLYVADSLNNVVREVDFKNNKVTTIAGSSNQGGVVAKGKKLALAVDLFYPTDIEFFPDKKNFIISNSGTGQLLQYNIETKKIRVVANIDKNTASKGNNTLTNITDVSAHNGKLYFVDQNLNALKVMDKKFNVKTLVGGKKLGAGYVDGSKNKAKLNTPTGVFANRNGVYIADSTNNKIRKYQYSSKKIKTIFGSSAGDRLGSKTEFRGPDGVIIVKDKMLIVDVDNNRVVRIDFKNMKSRLIDVIPDTKLPQEGFLEYLPNLERLGKVNLKSKAEIPINLSFDKGWKLNDLGPSFLNLLEVVNKKSANLIATYDWNMLKDNVAILPKLKSGKKYIIQGTIYYCQDKRNSLCYISSYEQEIGVSKNGKKVLNIEI